jgi:dihydropyrimidinase
MSNTVLIRGGTLVTPQGELRGDLLITGERIASVGSALPGDGAGRVIDASGCMVLPGVIDPHTHIQLDTGIYKTPDDWEVGTRTAACGGVTTVIDFATQFPGQDVRQALAARQAEIGGLAQIDYGLHMMLTALPASDAGLDGWMAELLDAGVNSVKVYTTYRPNYYEDDAALLRVLRAAAKQGVVVMVHCENDALVSAATSDLVRAGQTALANHGRARPALAEVEAANRVLLLANAVVGAMHSQASPAHRKLLAPGEMPGAMAGLPRNASPLQVYIVHCSVSGTVDQVIRAAARGQDAIAETTPQYLLLDETVYAGEHPEWGIMQPPLRAPEEKTRLWSQVASGAISTIGTDHCDYTIAQKRLSPKFNETAGGIPGMETMLPLLVTYGVMKGRISWSRLAELTGANPARIFGLQRKGVLAPGYDADVVIYDPRSEGRIRAEALHNLAGYTPYEGWSIRGAVRDVFCRGRRLVREGEFAPAPGWGRFVGAPAALGNPYVRGERGL